MNDTLDDVQEKGYISITIIEVVLGIGIIVLLGSILLVVLNPIEQFRQSRNAQRRIDSNTILNAVYEYSLDNHGALPDTLPETPKAICRSTTTASCSGLVSLAMLSGSYLPTIPADPRTATLLNSRYTIAIDPLTRHVTVAAPDAEGGEVIFVTK